MAGRIKTSGKGIDFVIVMINFILKTIGVRVKNTRFQSFQKLASDFQGHAMLFSLLAYKQKLQLDFQFLPSLT